MARNRRLEDQINEIRGITPPRPANQSASKTGSTRRKPKPYRFPGIQSNYEAGTRTNAAGESFETFTRPDRPGMTYHEYLDEDGNRRVVGFKRRTGPPKGLPTGG